MANGYLEKMDTILNLMKQLAVQSLSEFANNKQGFQNRQLDVSPIWPSTKFNGRSILDGSLKDTVRLGETTPGNVTILIANM